MAVTIICDFCSQPIQVTEDSPKIEKGTSGGIPYTRVTVPCPNCGRTPNVPQTRETVSLLHNRLEAAKQRPYGGSVYVQMAGMDRCTCLKH